MRKQKTLLLFLLLIFIGTTANSYSSPNCEYCTCSEYEAYSKNKKFFGKLTYKTDSLVLYKTKSKSLKKHFALSDVLDFQFSKCSRYIFVKRFINRHNDYNPEHGEIVCGDIIFEIYDLQTKKRIRKIKDSNLICIEHDPCMENHQDEHVTQIMHHFIIDLELKNYNLIVKNNEVVTHNFSNVWQAYFEKESGTLIVYFRDEKIKIYDINFTSFSKVLFEFIGD